MNRYSIGAAVLRLFFASLVLHAQLWAATQLPNGEIHFAASEANISGTSAKFNSAQEAIESWTNPDDTVSWEYKPTRWGMYDLEIVGAKDTADTQLSIEIAGQTFPFNVLQSRDRFQTSRVARVYIAKSEPFIVKVRCTKLTGNWAVRLKSLDLRPAPEGKLIVQAKDNEILLHSRDATTHSVMMRYEPATNKNCLGYWTNPNDAAEWKFTVKKPGTYTIQLWQGCGKGQGGSDVLVEVLGKTGRLKESRFVVEDTGHFQNFIPRNLGEVALSEPDEYSLWVRPQTKKAAAVLDVRQVVLLSTEEKPRASAAAVLRVARFDIDATPPIGSYLAYDPVTNKWDLGLRARGIVLLGSDEPIVLCAVDWIGIANEGHDAFRAAIAEAAGTTSERVALHALHQHDAPDCDFSAEKIVKDADVDARQFEGSFQREVLTNLASAIRKSLAQAQPITHLGLGEARVEKVASNRRIFGTNGKVRAVRYTACPDIALRDEPEGTIDPIVSLVSFWNGDTPVAVLSYYATHPQSYYRTGVANPDFPGLARFQRQLTTPAALHIHFNGAGGNIGAGKYNDGSQTNRLVLAERMSDGMRRAWEQTKREPISPEQIAWNVEKVSLSPSKHLSLEAFEAEVKERDPKLTLQGDASRLAWLRRCLAGHKLDVACLKLGRARILHMPGELFVEYQLAAKAERSDLFVAMAAYGDYGPWYIGTAAAYEEGGYETEPRSSNVGPDAEPALMGAIKKLLRD
jgi:hypothetical protein